MTPQALLKTCVYALHIASTPEQVWQALTSNAFISAFWEGEWRFESDWQTGSALRFYDKQGAFYSEGTVVLSTPPHKLVYTWPEPDGQRLQDEPECLSWEISESGPGTVQLKLVHENLSEAYFAGVSEGWPAILSSLKSLLEKGVPLAFHPRH
ncbi:MAG: SRPBCC domain-containing protein [Candidatus Sericytochromatia bacterium]